MMTLRLKKLQYYYSMLVVFPVIVIVQNLSAFLFPVLLVDYYKRIGNEFLKKITFVDFFMLLFAIGAIASVVFSATGPVPGAFSLGIAVLPNYLYWVTVVLFFASYAKKLDYTVIYKGIFFGTILSIVFYYTVNEALRGKFIFNSFTPNGFSFLLIAFGPVFIYYTQERYGRIFAMVAAVVIVAAGTLSGSRSGSILTLFTGFLTLYSTRLNFVRWLVLILMGTLIFFSLRIPAVQNFILGVNERTYNLIYNSEEVLATDQSYLIRVAQVEKGLFMFSERPVTGTGLNTFGYYSYSFKGDFEGFERINAQVKNLDALSAHNSYINMLAEGGILLLGPFVLLLLSLFIYLITNFGKIPEFQKPFFWGLLGISVHFYFISAIVNVFVWLLIGLAASAVRYNK